MCLVLRVKDGKGIWQFRTSENIRIEHYLIKPTRSILFKLGFSTETFEKEISNFHNLDKIKILEELAIIYFDVFAIFGETANIKIE